jgi:hypothetical protein
MIELTDEDRAVIERLWADKSLDWREFVVAVYAAGKSARIAPSQEEVEALIARLPCDESECIGALRRLAAPAEPPWPDDNKLPDPEYPKK